jgi:hypothetical protein
MIIQINTNQCVFLFLAIYWDIFQCFKLYTYQYMIIQINTNQCVFSYLAIYRDIFEYFKLNTYQYKRIHTNTYQYMSIQMNRKQVDHTVPSRVLVWHYDLYMMGCPPGFLVTL